MNIADEKRAESDLAFRARRLAVMRVLANGHVRRGSHESARARRTGLKMMKHGSSLEGVPTLRPAMQDRWGIVGHAVRESDQRPTIQKPRRMLVSARIATAERKNARELRPREHIEKGGQPTTVEIPGFSWLERMVRSPSSVPE